MTVLSYLYGIIIECAINSPVNGKNVINGLNDTEKLHLKEQMGPLGKLGSNVTSNIGIIPSVSKDVSVNFSEECSHVLTNNYRLNRLKGNTKIQNR